MARDPLAVAFCTCIKRRLMRSRGAHGCCHSRCDVSAKSVFLNSVRGSRAPRGGRAGRANFSQKTPSAAVCAQGVPHEAVGLWSSLGKLYSRGVLRRATSSEARAATPCTVRSLSRLFSPRVRVIDERGTSSTCARIRMRRSLAAPSTGGDDTRTRRRPSRTPSMPSREARG
jgi:hypothetical protein